MCHLKFADDELINEWKVLLVEKFSLILLNINEKNINCC